MRAGWLNNNIFTFKTFTVLLLYIHYLMWVLHSEDSQNSYQHLHIHFDCSRSFTIIDFCTNPNWYMISYFIVISCDPSSALPRLRDIAPRRKSIPPYFEPQIERTVFEFFSQAYYTNGSKISLYFLVEIVWFYLQSFKKIHSRYRRQTDSCKINSQMHYFSRL